MNGSAEQPLLSVEWWNEYFREGGGWERNGGRRQTRLFAESFCNNTTLNHGTPWTILDSSCALGDAMPVFHRFFPNAKLFGIDFSETAISRCRRDFPELARFTVSSMDKIDEEYDVIYSSHTLEHFVDFRRLARVMLQRAMYLCVLVPYNEQSGGKDLAYTADRHHVATFRENSFDFLLHEGLASRIARPKVFTVPGAWSWTLKKRVCQTIKNAGRLVLRWPLCSNPKVILFEIVNRHRSGSVPTWVGTARSRLVQ